MQYPRGSRTAILLNCSKAEVYHIRDQAKLEHRTVSGYVLNIVMRVVESEERLFAHFGTLHKFTPGFPTHPLRPRATVLLRCSMDEARQIRTAAQRRHSTISGFVLHALRRSWHIKDDLLPKGDYKTAPRVDVVQYVPLQFQVQKFIPIKHAPAENRAAKEEWNKANGIKI